jgi:hypothetical protein
MEPYSTQRLTTALVVVGLSGIAFAAGVLLGAAIAPRPQPQLPSSKITNGISEPTITGATLGLAEQSQPTTSDCKWVYPADLLTRSAL